MRISDLVFKEELFYSKINKNPEGCWEWMGGKSAARKRKNRGGYFLEYGKFHVNVILPDGKKRKKTIEAHRLMWIMLNGEIRKNMYVCHHCDNPKCVRPDHLYEESQRQNMLDCVSRGRHAMSRKTHCPNGHEYSSENTSIYRREDGYTERRCITCRREHDMKYKKNKRSV
jgi:hypothetical protein